MSHSGSVTLIALCLDAEIGVDVEAVRPIVEWADIAASHFSKEENLSINKEVAGQRMEAFFRCWTRKEALIKAIGMGLSIPLDSFTVSTSLAAPPALLHCAWDANAVSHWSFMHLEPVAGHIGAIAVENSGWSALRFAWP
jgi:4'-phosphopantetheinyl transferase